MLDSLLEFLTGTGIWQLFFKAAEGEIDALYEAGSGKENV